MRESSARKLPTADYKVSGGICGMKKKLLNERQLVNLLVKALKKNSPGIYIHVDRDSGNMRHTSSGWDFLAAMNGRVVFCECKVSKTNSGKLTDWQKYTRLEIQRGKNKFLVLDMYDRNSDPADFYIHNNEKAAQIHVSEINAEWLSL